MYSSAHRFTKQDANISFLRRVMFSKNALHIVQLRLNDVVSTTESCTTKLRILILRSEQGHLCKL